MIGYITLGTSDIKRGASFYDAIAKEPKRKAFRRYTVIGPLDRLRTFRVG